MFHSPLSWLNCEMFNGRFGVCVENMLWKVQTVSINSSLKLKFCDCLRSIINCNERTHRIRVWSSVNITFSWFVGRSQQQQMLIDAANLVTPSFTTVAIQSELKPVECIISLLNSHGYAIRARNSWIYEKMSDSWTMKNLTEEMNLKQNVRSIDNEIVLIYIHFPNVRLK